MDTRQAVLIMIQGPEPGSVYKLPDNRVSTIGRSSRNSINVVSPSVSRFHCEIVWMNGEWMLSDLNSRKGTMINNEWVNGRMALAPGDLIRMTNTVFRFDLVDEKIRTDEAMLAISEAMLEQRLQKKGEAVPRLDDIVLRSRLDAEADQAAAVTHTASLRRNVSLLTTTAVVVVVVSASLLFWAYRVRGRPPERGDAAARPTDGTPASPSAENLRKAARARADADWRVIEEALGEVSSFEIEANYTAALAYYERLERLELGAAAAALVRVRKDQTTRLARAHFTSTDERARRLLAEGKGLVARGLYHTLSERIGLPDLAQQARDKAAAIP